MVNSINRGTDAGIQFWLDPSPGADHLRDRWSLLDTQQTLVVVDFMRYMAVVTATLGETEESKMWTRSAKRFRAAAGPIDGDVDATSA